MVYVPYPFPRGTQPATFAVRTGGDPSTLLPQIRQLMADARASADGDVMTGVAYKQSKWRSERLPAGYLVLFGLLALLISCIGIFGMMTYTVRWRTTEIGIRVALGAQTSSLIGMIVKDSLIPAVAGMIAGLVAALTLTRLIDTVLFGVARHDPWTIAMAALAFLITALIAAFFPVRRACRVDPVKALRYE